MRYNQKTSPKVSPLTRIVTSLCVFVLTAMLGFGVSSAGAVGPAPEAENFIPRFGENGSGSGQIGIPVGIGTNPTTGDVYVSDLVNDRINEFTAWGNFIRAFGWGVADGTSNELQTCTTICFRGLEGAGAGEFGGEPWGVVVDASGDVYVRDDRNMRVQKFSASGQFLLMFGGGVDKTQVHKREEQESKAEPVTVTTEDEDVCTAGSGDECGTGSEGAGHGQISIGVYIALDPDGTIAVADKERIEEFEPDGAYKSEVKLPGKTVRYLAIDPKSGDFYVIFGSLSSEENVHELSPTGAALGTLEVKRPGFIAADSSGNVYVVEGGSEPERIFEFDSSGRKIAEFKVNQASGETTVYGLGTNTIGDLYVANNNSSTRIDFISAFGPPPVSFEPPPKVSPTIESEYALSVDKDSAVVQARINPHFWNDTTYYVQYGTEDCEVSACVSWPLAPGSRLTGKVVAESVTSSGVSLSGLQPGTTYHYRFVSESGGGGPVFGPDRTFMTFPELMENVNCANQLLRTGFSAQLPDCRAYEMISPIDKNGGDILTIPDTFTDENGLDQSSTSGDKFTYSSYRSFGDAAGAPYTSQYIAGRDPVAGWSTEAISPSHRAEADVSNANTFETDYELFSADLSSAWLSPSADPVLAPGAVEGFRTLYRRYDGSGAFEALTTVEPPTVDRKQFTPELQDVSSDGSHMVFRANDKLTPEASSETGIHQVYESYGGGRLRLVSVLPDGTASTQDSSAGSLNFTFAGKLNLFSSVSHAMSDDGSRVYWSETDHFAHPGKIYVRENADQEQSVISGGECVEPDKACTVAVSSKAAQFWTANTTGSRALYTITEGARTGELDEFNLEEDTSTPIAEKVDGVVGAGEDLSYIYFVSTEALAPGATLSQPNLYIRHEETTSFIATLSSTDTTGSTTGESVRSIDTREPVYHAARVTPDGRHIAFVSTRSLTGYDNIDTVTGKPDSEVYVYDSVSQVLACVSCARSGARPTAQDEDIAGGIIVPTLASIPGWESELYASRVLSDKGNRVFFDSYQALVPRDTNGREDVYEWESQGTGDCGAQSPAFSPVNGGCVSLISSGESPSDSSFVDASPNGNDVFFATSASLLPQDPGLVDIYDARVDGGFPAPRGVPASCEGEACQGSPVPPNDQTPASAVFAGPGDLVSTLVGAVASKSSVKKTALQSRSIALSRALRVCKAKGKARRRKSCEAAARKRYGASAKAGVKRSTKVRGK